VGLSKQLKISLGLSFWYANQAKSVEKNPMSMPSADANGNKKNSAIIAAIKMVAKQPDIKSKGIV